MRARGKSQKRCACFLSGLTVVWALVVIGAVITRVDIPQKATASSDISLADLEVGSATEFDLANAGHGLQAGHDPLTNLEPADEETSLLELDSKLLAFEYKSSTALPLGEPWGMGANLTSGPQVTPEPGTFCILAVGSLLVLRRLKARA